MSQQIRIRVLAGKGNNMTVPASLLENAPSPPQSVKCGLIRTTVRCKPNKSADQIELTPSLLHTLGLKDGLACTITVKGDVLHIGPVIGLFVGEKYIRRLIKLQNPKDTTVELVKANRDAATILYFFSNKDVKFGIKKVRGTYFDEREKRWKKHLLPFPTVLYDRGSGMKAKRIPLEMIRKKLEKSTPIKKINAQHYFNKLDLYKKLNRFENMRPYLPLTMYYEGPHHLKKMFQRTDQVYIKRLVSSNGYKILKIEKLSPAKYQLSTFDRKVKRYIAGNLSSVHKRIRAMYSGGRGLIIQQGIKIPKFNNRNYDLRATVQRTGDGKLELSNITVRVGVKGSPVTSTRTSSQCYKFDDFFLNKLEYSPVRLKELKDRILLFLLHTYRYTEQSYGTFGEIGIDFAVDTNDKIKFIECNAKPAKTSLYKSADPETIRKAFRNPLEFAKHLSGFNG